MSAYTKINLDKIIDDKEENSALYTITECPLEIPDLITNKNTPHIAKCVEGFIDTYQTVSGSNENAIDALEDISGMVLPNYLGSIAQGFQDTMLKRKNPASLLHGNFKDK